MMMIKKYIIRQCTNTAMLNKSKHPDLHANEVLIIKKKWVGMGEVMTVDSKKHGMKGWRERK